MTSPNKAQVTSEFTRTASAYAERTAQRYVHLDPVARSGIRPGARILEVGGGTGSFLSLFSPMAGTAVDLDLTLEMLSVGRTRDGSLLPVQGDGMRLPFHSRSFDLVASVQMLHHVPEPLPLLKEMRRVLHDEGKVMVIDQVAEESFEKASFMSELERLRDPSHAVSRPPSAIRALLLAAGLEIVSEEVVAELETLQEWMPPREFPASRIEETERFIRSAGHLTGMGFREENGGWVFERRRIIALAGRARG